MHVGSNCLFDCLENKDYFLGANEIGKEIGAVVIEVLIGIASGLLLGLLISYIPSRKARYKVSSSAYVPDVVCYASVYHTNIDLLPRQHKA